MGAREEGMTSRDFRFRNPAGDLISARLIFPKKRKGPSTMAVFCHAFGANKEAIWEKHLAPRLLSLGWACMAFDFPGCGKSAGKFSDTTYARDIATLERAVAAARKRAKFSRLVLVGHSRGGACALYYAARRRVAGMFLLAPRSDVGNTLSRFSADQLAAFRKKGFLTFNDKLQKRLGPGYMGDIAGRKGEPLRLAGRIACPVTIVHCAEDGAIALAESRLLTRKLRQGTLVAVPKGDHFFHGLRERAADELSRFARSLG